MGILVTFITAAALSADAFAVALGKGMAARSPRATQVLATGLYFGIFQALMTIAGFLLGKGFHGIIGRYAPLVACGMLAVIGINMIKESRSQKRDDSSSFGVAAMLPLAIATSIDAFATGTSLALLGQDNVTYVSLTIGAVTFILSVIGVTAGRILGTKLRSGAEITGGIILLLMATKAFVEFVLNI